MITRKTHTHDVESVLTQNDPLSPPIKVETLSKTYKKIEAVRQISFTISKGQVFGLIGPDGAGKTSVIQCLAGVLSADSGGAYIEGIDALKQPELIKDKIGYMPQGLGLNLYDSLSVDENISFFRDLRQVPEAAFRVNKERLLKMTHLDKFLTRPAAKLSGGMRQKLALICTLLHLPDILLLDEPTTGVDPISRREFWAIIHDLVATRGVTVLLSTSYMDEAERCHQIGLMHQGKLLDLGTPEALTKSLKGHYFQISSGDPNQLMNSLQQWQDAESMALFGRQIHLHTALDGTQLKTKLEQMGISDISFKQIEPSLEDLFMHHLQDRSHSKPTTDNTHHLQHLVLEQSKIGTIQCHQLSRYFGDFVAVDSVSFDLKAGEILGLLGPNGAGKTTLIKMLCGLLPISEGSAQVVGFDVAREHRIIKRHVGYMSQQFSLYPDLTVLNNIKLYAGLYGLSDKELKKQIDSLGEGLSLTAYFGRVTSSLPRGVRQRLSLACALLHNPALLILDEPTSGVDPNVRRQFWDHVHYLTQQNQISALVSTHYMDEAEHCDRLGFMQNGKMIVVDTPERLKIQAEAICGQLLVAEGTEYAKILSTLRTEFPDAFLYGRYVHWQSLKSEEDKQRAIRLLQENQLEAKIDSRSLSIEETFANYMTSEALQSAI